MRTVLIFMLVSLVSSDAFAQPYEIKFDVQSASGWFGGDDRPGQQRNVAVGQSVFIDNPIHLESFAFRFSSAFDFAQNPTGSGHEVTLRLHIRDSAGAVLRTEDVVVPDTFNGGWVTWPDIQMNLDGPATFIFTTYLVGGFDSNQVTSGHTCDLNAGYSGGDRYTKHVLNDSDAVTWSDWGTHSWDSNFWLLGTLNTTGIGSSDNQPDRFVLHQNHPNPFNPTTRIEYALPRAGYVTLNVYDVLGQQLFRLVDELQGAGARSVTLDGADLPTGVYFYRLDVQSETGGQRFSSVKKMVVLK